MTTDEEKTVSQRWLARIEADIRADERRKCYAEFDATPLEEFEKKAYKKGQTDFHNRFIERISSWGIESSKKEAPVLRRVMEIIDEEASESAGGVTSIPSGDIHARRKERAKDVSASNGKTFPAPEQPHIAGLSIAECECKTCNQMTNWERNPEGRNCVKCKKKKED